MVTEEGNIEKFQVLSINHLPLQTNCVHPSKVIKEITTFAMRTLSRVFASKDSMESDDLFFGMPGEKLLPVSERLSKSVFPMSLIGSSHSPS